jgi:hypothetical protein
MPCGDPCVCRAGEWGSDGADGKFHDVVCGHGFFLQEGFAIFNVDEGAVGAGEQVHAVVEFVDGEKNALFAFAFGGTELGAIGEDGFAALGVFPGDIHDETGRHALEGSGVEDFERSVRFTGERQLLESREEAGFVAECGGVIVVGMAGFPIGKDYGSRTEISNHLGEAHFVLAGGLNVGVRNAEIAAPCDFEDFGGEHGLFCASFRSATGAHFTGGEIEDAGFITFVGHFQQRAAAGEFNVVGVCGDGEQI